MAHETQAREGRKQPLRKTLIAGLSAFALSGFLLSTGGALAQDVAVEAPSTYDISDKDGPYKEVVRTSKYVAVRDGTGLAMNLYFPAENGKAIAGDVPTIFVATPYRARFLDPRSGGVNEVALSDRLGLRSLLANGYAVAVADIRGKGASYGYRRGFQDRTEALDSRDLIEWLGAQDWGNGNVGMLGCSYLGGSTLHAATTAPPSLKAVFVGATDIDKYLFVRRGGMTAQFNTRPDEPLSDDLASIPVDADTSGAMRDEAVAQHAYNTPMAPLWYGMPYRDSLSAFTGNAFWQEASPYNYMETLKNSGIEYYFWGNWNDEPNESVLMLADNLDGRLLVAPGSHCVAPTSMDFGGELVRYFDLHLRGQDDGYSAEEKFKIWREDDTGEGEWVHTNDFPMDHAKRRTFALSGDTLTESDGSSGETKFVVDYGVGAGEYFSFWPASLAEHGSVFTSAPLKEDMTIAGYPVVNLRLSSDQPDPAVFAYLEAVLPDGKVDVLSFSRLASDYRKESEPPYKAFDLPWHSGLSSDIQPVAAGETVDLSFYMLPRFRKLAAGTQLRLVVTGADPRQRNLPDLVKDPAPIITIETGPGASFIDIPVISDAGLAVLGGE